MHFFITHIVDSAATRPNKEGDISLSVLAWCDAEVVKKGMNLLWGGKRHRCQYQMKRPRHWHPPTGGTSLDFLNTAIVVAPGCTYVWRSCKLLNYKPSVESLRVFTNMHWWHWEYLTHSITIWQFIFRRLSWFASKLCKLRERHSTFSCKVSLNSSRLQQ